MYEREGSTFSQISHFFLAYDGRGSDVVILRNIECENNLRAEEHERRVGNIEGTRHKVGHIEERNEEVFHIWTTIENKQERGDRCGSESRG